MSEVKVEEGEEEERVDWDQLRRDFAHETA